MTSIKNDLDKSGDLGIVAEESRGSQQIMFKPSPLTLRAVFKKLREIADLKGIFICITVYLSFYHCCHTCESLSTCRSFPVLPRGKRVLTNKMY